jgi:LysR family glycine cleavage system transcriptional activator
MSYRLPSLNALRAFEVAARHLSFKKAADELSVTPTAISHQIRGLEDYLGIPLFRRLTRALQLTAEGEAMLPKIREGIECFVLGVDRARRRAEGGQLTVVAPPTFASRWLVPRLQSFAQTHPQVKLHVAASLRTIDSREQPGGLGEAPVDPREGDSGVSIRFGTGAYEGCRVDRLFAPTYTAVCSPKLLMGKRPMRRPSDLRYHVLIHDDTIADDRLRPTWEEWLRAAQAPNVDSTSGPHFSNSGLALSAAIDGLGIALAPKSMVAADVAAGRLAIPFAVSIGGNYAYYLVVPQAVAHRPAVTAFREWILDQSMRESKPAG